MEPLLVGPIFAPACSRQDDLPADAQCGSTVLLGRGVTKIDQPLAHEAFVVLGSHPVDAAAVLVNQKPWCLWKTFIKNMPQRSSMCVQRQHAVRSRKPHYAGAGGRGVHNGPLVVLVRSPLSWVGSMKKRAACKGLATKNSLLPQLP